jgi:hypothetical protein
MTGELNGGTLRACSYRPMCDGVVVRDRDPNLHLHLHLQSLHRQGYALRVPAGSGFKILKKNQHMNVVRLSVLRTVRLYAPWKYSW